MKAATKQRARLAVAATTALFVVAVIYWTMRIASYECEVCMEFRGLVACRTVQASTIEEARTSAINNACALIASGVTDTLACERQMPTKLVCREYDPTKKG